jgi:hypothetical protein
MQYDNGYNDDASKNPEKTHNQKPPRWEFIPRIIRLPDILDQVSVEDADRGAYRSQADGVLLERPRAGLALRNEEFGKVEALVVAVLSVLRILLLERLGFLLWHIEH